MLCGSAREVGATPLSGGRRRGRGNFGMEKELKRAREEGIEMETEVCVCMGFCR